MIRTFNKVPLSVSTPSKSEINEHFFNHYEWKGVQDDKNFLSSDPTSFAASNNVFVDAEGLLKSRPSVKIKIMTDGKMVLSNIVNVWEFDDIIVYHTKYNDLYYLTFADPSYADYVQVESEEDIRIIPEDRKLFIFSKTAFKYYDIKTREYLSADKFIYIPSTNIIVDGESDKKNESKNALIDAYITTYLFTSLDNVKFNDLIGNDFTLTISDKKYKITNFKKDQQYTFVDKYANINEDNYLLNTTGDAYYILGGVSETSDNFEMPLIFTSERESMILCTYNNIRPTTLKRGQTNWTIYHTVDGLVFRVLPAIEDTFGLPIISRDGSYCIVLKSDGPYIISLLKTGETIKYPGWINLMQTLDNNWYSTNFIGKYDLSKYVGKKRNMQNITVNGYFITDTDFAFTFCQPLSDDSLQNIGVVISHTGSNFYLNKFEVEYTAKTNTGTEKHKIVSYDYYPLVYAQVIDKNIFTIIKCKSSVTDYSWYSGTYLGRLCITYIVKNNELYTSTSEFEKGFNVSKETSNFNTYCIEDSHIINSAIICTNDVCKIAERILDVKYSADTNNKYSYSNSRIRITQYSLTDKEKYLPSSYILNDDSVTLRLSYPSGYMLTNKKLYRYSVTSEELLEPLSLLFEAYPVAYYSSGNTFDSIYLVSNNILYTNKIHKPISVEITTVGKINYDVFNAYTKLDHHYFGKDNKLYISANIKDEENVIKWYLPEINIQSFDYCITNLHPISSDTVAVFFNNSMEYVKYDTDVQAYRYYKSKLDVGCRKGSDVITTYDGKYTIFSTDRGLVAMNYQDFIASEEQTLQYVSDPIHDMFISFCNEENSTNEIKLFKYEFWIAIYKPDSKKGFLFDLRNNSWWPFELKDDISKIVKCNRKPLLLSNHNLFTFSTADDAYYDYDNARSKISWFIKSQKLYLGAINYYKHISNFTFVSVHNTDKLNIESTSFNLFLNLYRKKIDNNINNNDYVTVEYNVENVRTYVQRVNYSKVNEVEYMLKSDDDAAFNVPLSLSNITLKYKIGGQVR